MERSRSAATCSSLRPAALAKPAIVWRVRSVRKEPGSRLLIVTLCFAVWRARPAMKPVRPARAPLDSPSAGIGAFTAPEVMLTMRPKLARDHAVDSRLDQLDRRQHVGVDRLQPGLAIPFAKIAGRRAAGIGDENVGRRARRERGPATVLRGDVAGDSGHLDAARLANFGRRRLQRIARLAR